MSRWIDAEYCEDFFDRWESRVKDADPVTVDVVQNTRTLLRDAPSIDIVRCKECKKANTKDCSHSYWDDDWGVWRIGYNGDDWFCADGERKESE